MVSTPLKNISQIGSFPQVGVKIKNIWNHKLGYKTYIFPTKHQHQTRTPWPPRKGPRLPSLWSKTPGAGRCATRFGQTHHQGKKNGKDLSIMYIYIYMCVFHDLHIIISNYHNFHMTKTYSDPKGNWLDPRLLAATVGSFFSTCYVSQHRAASIQRES